MTQIRWWVVDVFSRLLEPAEREVVLGDFADSRETSGRALRGVLGLVARRQAALWAGWRPWLTAVGLIVPLGMLLSIVSRRTADGSAVYLWLYANNWDWALTTNPGFWSLLAETGVHLLVWYLTLACFSWTSGFVLGSASRSMNRINGVLMCLMLLFGALVGAPRYFAFCEDYLHRTFRVAALPDYNAAVFDLPFYRVLLPLIVQGVLVALPAVWGLRQGLEAVRFRLPLRISLWIAAVATLAAMVIQDQAFWLFLNSHVVRAYRQPGNWLGWGIRLLQSVVFWPVAYLVVREVGRRWQRRIA